MARGRALRALVAITGLAQGEVAGHDSVSMLQHQVHSDQLPQTTIQSNTDEAMQRWIAGLFRILRTRPNPLLQRCCHLAEEHGVKPWRTWGTMNDSMVALWNTNNCNHQVGAHIENFAVGTPYCAQHKAYTILARPSELGGSDFEEEVGAMVAPSCTDEDRLALNNTYLGKHFVPVMEEACMPENLATISLKHGQLRTCVSEMMNISKNCAKCHTTFVRSISGMKAPYAQCLDTCYPLMTCPRLSMCSDRAQRCSACVQPALYAHNKCIGGPTMNPLTMENVFENMIRFSPR